MEVPADNFKLTSLELFNNIFHNLLYHPRLFQWLIKTFYKFYTLFLFNFYIFFSLAVETFYLIIIIIISSLYLDPVIV